ncbi:hypothetical protein ACIBEA_30140 [Streptomyces sp. NPDC051555]|uniref:hypothetical protein n=1 Tax=Streptomyces sp. NPDC051555 TaxID=3365657 RepID=UPI00379EC393
MADTLPTDTTSLAIAGLPRSPASRYTPSPAELARQAAANEHLIQSAAALGLSPEEYIKAGGHATDEHWVLDLDADSVFTIPGACCRSYLTGGQS